MNVNYFFKNVVAVCAISLQFFTTFWSLSMYDLHVPTTAYDKQIQLHKSQIALEDDKDTVRVIFLPSVAFCHCS